MPNLLRGLIRLAHDNPEIRKHLFLLIRKAQQQKMLLDSDAIRKAYYEVADGISEMRRALGQDSKIRGDTALRRKFQEVDVKFREFGKDLNAGYLWD